MATSTANSRLDWLTFNPRNVTGIRGQSILAVRADGKGYYGRVVDINPEYLELENGSQKQMLRFFDSPTIFALVSVPKRNAPTLADRKLI